ncbi:polysaccharide deacetylase family protein [Alicyclobacillus sp. SO9]|uniref:polysaccharide deacetylase family protein n=1 Tax=Alicyclobacillus sp. SO9 TaxID=2665646 RepID=UPI0018E87049|nr:polysaccharide deacetylase family protein [Alicyclobacillus sp. SO9]QQE80267.1 polysaccharide deacetylase family protein [Alicyclobacillus sp. SO9]
MNRFKLMCITFTTSLLLVYFVAQPAKANDRVPKVLYLTFDDGPGFIYTPKILDILQREHAKATFFVIGNRVLELPGIIKRMSNEGHEIGNHGFIHPSFEFPNQETQPTVSDIIKTDKIIEKICHKKPLYYRPPGGVINESEIKHILAHGHRIALWTVDSEDWKTASSQKIYDNVTQHARPNSIVLFHDGVSNSRYTIQALPNIIHYYRSKGYVFSTLPITSKKLPGILYQASKRTQKA